MAAVPGSGLHKVEASAQETARAGEDRDAQRCIAVEFSKRRGKGACRRGIHRVPRSRSVNGDDGDWAVDTARDRRLISHPPTLRSTTDFWTASSGTK